MSPSDLDALGPFEADAWPPLVSYPADLRLEVLGLRLVAVADIEATARANAETLGPETVAHHIERAVEHRRRLLDLIRLEALRQARRP